MLVILTGLLGNQNGLYTKLSGMFPLPLKGRPPIPGNAACFDMALTCPEETGLETADCICIVLVHSCDCIPTSKCDNNNADSNWMILTAWLLEHSL